VIILISFNGCFDSNKTNKDEIINENIEVFKDSVLLKPQYNSKNLGNVIQGISLFEDNIFVTQTYSDENLYINILNKDGYSIFNKQFNSNSYGQDLSIEKEGDKLFFYTVGDNWKGIDKYEIKYDVSTKEYLDISYLYNIELNISKNTSSISEDKLFFTSHYNDKIYIYENNQEIVPLSLITTFSISDKQTLSNEWVQGISMKENLIYLLTSNNSINDNKLLFVYDFYGNIILEKKLYMGRENALIEGDKWEMEGLSFYNQSLYTTVMTGIDGNNTKRLFKIDDF
jgi:hypothetical protein